MISGMLIINLKGDVIISRSYREDISRTAADAFRMQVIQTKDSEAPIRHIGSCSFFYVRHENVFFVAVTRRNVNAAMVFSYLYRLIGILKSYFNDKLDEESIRGNFVLIYELMDETMDYGYPQLTETEVLKMYVTQGGIKDSLVRTKEQAQSVTIKATGAVPWRDDKVKYRKNEVFIDVVESINLLMSSNGDVLSQSVSGQVMVKAYLSGMPECKFGMNDKLVLDRHTKRKEVKEKKSKAGLIELDDVTFHQCVKLGKFDHDRTTSFVPPDGEFELMRYRLTDNINLPFKVFPIVTEHGRSRIEASLKVKALFPGKLFATGVIIKIPCPKNTNSTQVSTGIGKAKYDPGEGAIVWKIKKFQGETESSMSAEITLSSTMSDKKLARGPITMDFNVPMFTSSGLHVRFLKVYEKSNYTTTKWVRYITKAGTYENRT